MPPSRSRSCGRTERALLMSSAAPAITSRPTAERQDPGKPAPINGGSQLRLVTIVADSVHDLPIHLFCAAVQSLVLGLNSLILNPQSIRTAHRLLLWHTAQRLGDRERWP